MSVLKHTRAWSLLALGFSFYLQAETPQTFSKSLIFDQSFDSAPVRPLKVQAKVFASQVVKKQEILAARSVQSVFPNAGLSTPAVEKIPAYVAPLVWQEALGTNTSVNTKATNIESKLSTVNSPVKVATVAESKPVAPVQKLIEEVSRPNTFVQTKVSAPRSLASVTLNSKRAGVLIIDESAYLRDELVGVSSAKVQWIHPMSKLNTEVSEQGIALSPYPKTLSVRFVVEAPGYLPAIGYAIQGMLTPVVMVPESRLGPIVKSLDVVPQPQKTLILGRMLSRKLKSLSRISLDTSNSNGVKSFYSMGSFGLFHSAASESGPRGDFLLSSLDKGLQYLLPNEHINTEETKEWPASLLDLQGSSAIVTTTILEPQQSNLSTQIVDAFSLEKPETGIYLTVGGQRGLIQPDKDGIVDFEELYLRNSVDLIEVRAQGYYKTWINSPALSDALPEMVLLFTDFQLREMLGSNLNRVQIDLGLTLGHLRPEGYARPVEVRIYDSFGKEVPEAQVFYFDQNNQARFDMKATDPVAQKFGVANLRDGEWHAVLVDPKTGRGLGVQVFRTESQTISQIQF